MAGTLWPGARQRIEPGPWPELRRGSPTSGLYPLAEVRRFIDKAQSFDKRFDTLIVQDDAIDLTPDLVERLLGSGWERKPLEEAVANKARYSPSRNSILYPQMFGSSDDDDEGDGLGDPGVASS